MRGSIQAVDNKSETAISAPFSASGFIPTNVYVVGDGAIETAVWAGSYASSPSTGAIIKTTESWVTGLTPQTSPRTFQYETATEATAIAARPANPSAPRRP